MTRPQESRPETAAGHSRCEPAAQEPFYRQCVAEMVCELEAVRDLPGLNRFRQTHELPRAFFAHFNAFLGAYDRLIDFALAHSGDDRRIFCKKGCSNCCIDLVRGITTAEIVNIYHHVRLWPDCKQLFEYHRDSAERFSYILLELAGAGAPPPDGRDPRVAEAHMRFNLLKRPCGFLDQATGCCRIYPVRPVACRYFFSLDPPETCTPSHAQYFRRRTRTVHLPEEIHALLRQIDHGFGFRPLNYLSGAFCQFTAEIMRLKPISVVG